MSEPDPTPIQTATQTYGQQWRDLLEAEQEAHADTRGVLNAEQTAHDTTRRLLAESVKQYADHMATHEPQLTPEQDLIGVQVFTDRGHYTNYPRIREHVAYTGFKRARSMLKLSTTQAQIDQMNWLSDNLDVEWNLTIGPTREVMTAAQRTEIVDKLGRLHKVRLICNWNEPNNRRSTSEPTLDGWVTKTADHGAWLYNDLGDQYTVGSMQLWAGTMTKHNADLDLCASAVRGTFHKIAWHLYKPGEDRLADFERRYFGHFGQLPVVCTETGMSTAMNQTQGAEKMTPADQATYLKAHTGLYVKRGYEVYVFELENGPNENTNREDGLGLYFDDGTPKPSATMFRELLTA